MDPSAYKDVTTSRGIKYHYYHSAPVEGKETILFLHGCPSTSYDWHRQVDYFKTRGYGVIVPDLLGYGGTDKPLDPAEYLMSKMCQDVVDILIHEDARNVISIGHDWGAGLNSRIATLHQDDARFKAFGYLAVGYVPPDPNFDINDLNKRTEETFGYTCYGYWYFLNEDDAGKIVAEHSEAFFSLWFCDDPTLWKTDFAPIGKMKEWILSDRKTKTAEYISPEDLEKIKKNLLQGGFAAPTCWYKANVRKLNNEDVKTIPPEKYVIKKPVFYGAATQDYVCLAPAMKQLLQMLCPNHTIVDFDTSHWVYFAQPQKVNEELEKWIQTLN